MFYHGIVEDRNDPLRLGRVRVRCYGIHSHEKALIPTEDLPWATVLSPTTSSAFSGVGETTKMVEGTFVLVVFNDPEDLQYPIVLGTIAGVTRESLMAIDGQMLERGNENHGFQDPNNQYPRQNYIDKPDLPKLAGDSDNEFPRTTHRSRNDLFRIDEPEDLRPRHEYPYNQVKQSESGHFEEWDDTAGNERLGLQHKSGTFREIRPDGTKVEKIVGSNYQIIAEDNNVYIQGTVNLHINESCNTYIKGDWNIRVDGNQNINVTGNITETAKNVTQRYDTIAETARIGDVDYNNGEITVAGITQTKHRHTDTPGLGAGTTSGPRG